jgi:hypothetical protein
LKLSFDGWTAGDDRDNKNPNLSEASITIQGQVGVLEAVGDAPSCGAAVVEVARGKEVSLDLNLGDALREAGTEEEAEILQVSHFSTQGHLDRQFSILMSEEGPEMTLTWEAPDEAGPVKQYAVVRDGRGGVSWISYSVCVL